METFPKHLIILPDGRKAWVAMAGNLRGAVTAPFSLLKDLGIHWSLDAPWLLKPVSESSLGRQQTICMVRSVLAGALKSFDPRQTRLQSERKRLEAVNAESDFVRVEPIDVLEGTEPEHYKVTFLCRGIVGIDASQRPIYGDHHQVEIYCDEEFPTEPPRLRWLTDIWHPNIQHEEPKGVCINKAEWLGAMGLDDLCRQLFEMVQYKNYHAVNSKPYPLDPIVARWVLEYAEPRGIVDKKRRIFVDDRPFVRPGQPSQPEPSVGPRVKPVVRPTTPIEPIPRIKVTRQQPSETPSSGARIRLVGSRQRITIADARKPRVKIVTGSG